MRTVITAIVVLVLSLAAAAGGFLAVDHFVPSETRERHNDVAGFVYAVVGPMYAILLAFVVFVVWTYYEDAKSAATNEAVAVYAVWGVADGFNGQQGLVIKQAAIAYGESAIRDDWPAVANGGQSPKTTAAMDALRKTVQDFNPAGERDSDLYALALTNMHDLLVDRNVRILKGEDTLHPILWIGLIAGAVLTIAFSYVFGVRDRRAHLLMIGFLTVSIVGILFMIKTIDGPFRGDVSVKPDAMEQIVTKMQASHAVP